MVETRIVAILEEAMGLESNTLAVSTVLDDLEEWDSVARVSVSALLDDSFHLSVSAKHLLKCVTVGDIINLVSSGVKG